MTTAPESQTSFLEVLATGQRAWLTPVLDVAPVFTIGADARCNLQLAGSGVSDVHAVVTLGADGSCRVAPRYPQQMVRVNGRPIRLPWALQPGDVIEIGAYTLRFDRQALNLPQSMLPQVRTAPTPLSASSIQRMTPVTRPALAPVAAPALAMAPAGGEIYLPNAQTSATQGSGFVWGVLTVLGIVLVMAFLLVQNTPGLLGIGQAAVAENPFALRDGNITVLMFDADW